MARSWHLIMMWATLMLFWVLLNGSLAPEVLLVGAAAAIIIGALFRSGLAVTSEFRFTPAALLTAPAYVAFFLKELIRSNLRLAAIVLSPSLPLHPGIVKVRTKLQSRMGRLLLANSITLTPGTLTVEMDGEWLYVHWVTVEHEDIESATASIVAGFERYLEVMYG